MSATYSVIKSNTSTGTTSGSITVDNNGGVIKERWCVAFDTTSTGRIFGENVGLVHTFSNLTSAMEPLNGTNKYFSIPSNYFNNFAANDSYYFYTLPHELIKYAPQYFSQLVYTGEIDIDVDTFKFILLKDTLTPNKDIHKKYSDISAYEADNGNGYTSGGLTLTKTGVVSLDNVNDNAYIEFDDLAINASGGQIGPCKYTGIIDDSHTDKPIFYICEELNLFTITDGNSTTIKNLKFIFGQKNRNEF